MARLKVEFCLKKKTHPEHNFSVTFVAKVGTIRNMTLRDKAVLR